MAIGSPSDGFERTLQLLEHDDRGVFGTEGLHVTAGIRKRFKTAMLPVMARAWQHLRENTDESTAEAEKMLLASLPRDEADLKDDRYFGVYCGLAEVERRRDDKLAALEHYHRAIELFPSSVRRGHLEKLAELGVDVAQWIRSERDDGFSETDAAAILQRVIRTMEPLSGTPATAAVENRVATEFGRLEIGSGHVTRGNFRKTLG